MPDIATCIDLAGHKLTYGARNYAEAIGPKTPLLQVGSQATTNVQTPYRHTNTQLRTCAIKKYLPVIWFRLEIFNFAQSCLCSRAKDFFNGHFSGRGGVTTNRSSVGARSFARALKGSKFIILSGYTDSATKFQQGIR